MKLRTVRVVSKETGLTQGYKLQRRVLPFWWTTVKTYSDDACSGQIVRSRIERGSACLMVRDGPLGCGKDALV